ncbi:MAG: S-layer homology domain-containing protein [Syntrophomonadaceae bacterium]|nr:S-layer homology domain-containing protein [Syntrophomonadaceae bacterium]
MKWGAWSRKVLSLLLAVLLLAAAAPALGCEEGKKPGKEKRFEDLSYEHWAYKQILDLVERGVLAGYPDRTFKPGNTVTRAEFAKMMVLALDLPVRECDSSFVDIKDSHWACSYLEAAKYYLTGYRTSAGDYFRPSTPAVREDMAVALVKALGYEDAEVDEGSLPFADSWQISPNLRKYVAIAVKYNIMQGDQKGNQRTFRPQDPLKRAEAAVLLAKVMAISQGQKVTYGDDEKVTYPDEPPTSEYEAPAVTGEVYGDHVVLRWQVIDDSRLQGYRVVISKNDPKPAYPDDGYLYYITDEEQNFAVIDGEDAYHGGDFGGQLVPGQSYYFSVTAVYDDRRVRGNAVALTWPED